MDSNYLKSVRVRTVVRGIYTLRNCFGYQFTLANLQTDTSAGEYFINNTTATESRGSRGNSQSDKRPLRRGVLFGFYS